MSRRAGKRSLKVNRRRMKIGRTKNRRQRGSRRTKNRRQRTIRRRQRRQRGGFTTSVSSDAIPGITTSVATSETEAVAQDCNLRNDANIFQSTFDNVANSVLPEIDNYLLVNNDVYVTQ